MNRFIPIFLILIAAMVLFAGAPPASAAAPELSTYTAPNGEWSVQYPTKLLHAEQLTPEIAIFISKDRHTIAAIDSYTAGGSMKAAALNARSVVVLRAIYNKAVKNTGTIAMPGARWQTGFTFATGKGSVGAARYQQNGRIDRDYRVFGFVYGYKANSETSMLPMLQAIGESLQIHPPAEHLSQARDALRAFLGALAAGRYADAAEMYAGSYEVLQTWNPDVPASNQAKLLRLACAQNGLNCLRLKRIVGETAIAAGEFHFVVELMNANGTLFVQGPCCGDTTGPTITRFPFTVTYVNGAYSVHDLPPYTP